jgi:hypothetical protein
MRATWRDGAATVLAAAVVGVYAGHALDWSLPLIGDVRLAILVVGILGLAACIVGADPAAITSRTAYTAFASGLGVTALLLVIVGLITGWELVLTALAVVTLALYAVATIRHLLRERPAAVPA